MFEPDEYIMDDDIKDTLSSSAVIVPATVISCRNVAFSDTDNPPVIFVSTFICRLVPLSTEAVASPNEIREGVPIFTNPLPSPKNEPLNEPVL
jgi:hypothetical protein